MIQIYDLAGKNDLRFSPYCWRIKYLLNILKIDYKTIPTTFNQRLNNPLFGESRLPTIIDNEQLISDSFTIAQYIENNYTEKDLKLINNNLEVIRFINHWSDHFLNYSIVERVAFDIIECLHDEDKKYFVESRTKRFGMHPKEFQELNVSSTKNEFDKCCNFLNNILLKQEFILEDGISYADIIILGSLTWGDKVSKNTKINEKFIKLIEWKNKLSDLCK